MPLPELTPDEKALIRSAMDGKCCDLSRTTVRAEVLRVLLIRAHDPAIPEEFYESNSHRWVIKGTTFEDCVNLSDGRLSDGGALPALQFIECEFKQGFCADNAHLERLEFNDCRFGAPTCDPASTPTPPPAAPGNTTPPPAMTPDGKEATRTKLEKVPEAASAETGDAEQTAPVAAQSENEPPKAKELGCTTESAGENQISLRNVRILGELRMVKIKPIVDGGLLRVDAKSARVGASVILKESALKAPTDLELVDPLRTPYALNFRNAEVHADLFLQPKVVADGGITIFGARIGGDIRAFGLTVKDGYTDNCRKSLRDRNRNFRYALNLASAHVEGNVYAGSETGKDKFRVEGMLTCHGLHVNGDLVLRGAVIDAKGEDQVAIDMRSVTVHGSLLLDNTWNFQKPDLVFSALGGLLLDNAVVHGNSSLEGALSRLQAVNFSVAGDASIGLEVDYLIDLSRASINGRLDLSHVRFKEEASGTSDFFRKAADQSTYKERSFDDRPRLLLVDADIKRSLTLGSGFTQDQEFKSVRYLRSRRTTPICYDGVSIIEIEARVTDPLTQLSKDAWAGFLLKANEAPVVLRGNSAVFHGLNSQSLLRLSDDDKRRDYLRLFCAYVWGDEGPFKIIESSSQIPSEVSADSKQRVVPEVKEIVLSELRGSTDVEADAYVLYSNSLYYAKFLIKETGYVEMKKDDPGPSFDSLDLPAYRPPLQYATEGSCYANQWEFMKDEEALGGLVPDWKFAFVQKIISFADAFVDLSDASCGTLEDADGAAWGKHSLTNLTNFTYARISPSEDKPVTRVDHISRLCNAEELQRTRCSRFVNENHEDALRKEKDQLSLDTRTWWEKPLRWKTWLLWLEVRRACDNFAGWTRGMWEAVRSRCDVLVGNLLVDRDHLTRERAREARRVRYTLKLVKERPWWSKPAYLWWLFWDEALLAGRGKSVSSLPRPIYLRRQWLANRPSHNVKFEFHPQPYVQLAQVLRSEGDEESARKIEREKIDLDLDYRRNDAWKHHRPLVWLGLLIWKPLYGRGFGYGLSVLRAAITLILFWLLGAASFLAANQGRMLSKTEARAAKVITRSYQTSGAKASDAQAPTESTTYAQDNRQENADSPCGRDINPLLYAVESATPFLNLHQQTRCDIRAPDDKAAWWCGRNWLEVGKLGYQIIGYLITSLAVLTFSGIARRWEQK